MRTLQRTAVSFADRVLKRLGLRLIPQWRLEDLAQSSYLTRLFDHHSISGVIDVGANSGQFRDFLRGQVGFSGPILSVEPNPWLTKGLVERAAQDPYWRIEQLALGTEPGKGELNITKLSEFSSLLEPSAVSKELFETMTGVQEVVTVQIERLDNLIRLASDWLGDRIYLKLDTQGFDLHVLAGLQSERERVVAAQTEACFKPLYSGAPVYTQSMEAFLERGFVVSSMYPLPTIHFPKLIEFDLHFVNAPRS